MNHFIFYVVFIFSLIYLRNCDRSAHTYKIHIESLEECPDLRANKSDIKWSAKYFRFNKTAHAVNFTVNIPFVVDKKIRVRFHILKWGDGGWRPNYFKIEKSDPCVNIQIYFGKFARNIFRIVGIDPHKCPIDGGTYSAHNLYVPLDLIDVPFFYGKFKLIIDGFRQKKRIGCILATGSLLEKQIYDKYSD